MSKHPLDVVDETRRLEALSSLSVLDTPPDGVFDAITAAAVQVCHVPIALVSLIDANRQWFKSNIGLPGVAETPREVAFCDHAIRGRQLFEIADATLDPRFLANPLVTGEPNIRFYAGAPIILTGGECIGTVCVIDTEPRELDESQRAMLRSLAAIATASLIAAGQQAALRHRLADSEIRYRRLYESTPAILHSVDPMGRLIDVSDRWLAVMGYGRDEVMGRPSTDFLTPASQRLAREQVLPDFFRTGRCDRIEYQFVTRDGTVLDVLLSAVLERDDQGLPLRSLALLEDVTAAKAMSAELRNTHARLDAIVENVPAMLGYWDTQGVTRFVNREFQATLGLPPDEIIGHQINQLFNEVDPLAYQALAPYIDLVMGGKRQEFELPMLTVTGLRQLRLTLVPDQPTVGQINGFYALAHDITGRKALELRLTDSESRYRAMFDHLNSGFALHEMVCDSTGKPIDYKFLAINTMFTELTGLKPLDTIGRRVTEVMPGIETDPANWIGTYGEVVRTGKAIHFEQHASQSGKWFDVAAYRPAPGQFAVIVLDVTQRKKAETALQEAFKEKETLLKEVYHRVKNNLQVVQSLLSLQRRSVPDLVARAALDDSIQRVRAMALVHEKLYQSGNLSAVDLREYTSDLLKQISEATGAIQRNIVFRAEVEALEVGLDAAIPFGLLVTELMSNAMKHAFASGQAGEVLVTLESGEEGWRLSVADDGAGLPPGFDLAQTHSMGLKLASNLARQIGGSLSAGPGERGGAVFSVCLKGMVPA